jgi:predicted nucleic acid-binding protein
MYEWLRGPRVELDLELQRELCPSDQTVAFNAAEATVAARIYKVLKRSRGREMDIAIAACAIEHGAAIWTLNAGHFHDIPGLRLYQPKPGTARSKQS